MKRTIQSIKATFFLLLFLSSQGLVAQVASTTCLEETRESFKKIDAKVLMAGAGSVTMEYLHTYVMKMDPKQETKEAREVRTYGNNYYRLDSPDELVSGDSKETFTYRKFQNVIYRTNASLEKGGLIPMASEKLFDHCLVRECHFVPAPGQDSISYKRAFMTVDAAGQKAFQVKDLEFITNPHDGKVISVKVNFTDRSLYKWSFFQFDRIEANAGAMEGSAAKEFLGEGNDLKEKFEGVTLQDYRR